MNSNTCELCSSETNVTSFNLPKQKSNTLSSELNICGKCQEQMSHPLGDVNHWRALNENIWTENAAVKVIAWRVLNKLSTEGWAQDLLTQLDLDEETLEWAKEELSESAGASSQVETRDSNGTVLKQGDSVTLIKDLEVKGAGFTAKRGTLVKNIALTEDPGLIEGKVNGTQIVLKTIFLKKAI